MINNKSSWILRYKIHVNPKEAIILIEVNHGDDKNTFIDTFMNYFIFIFYKLGIQAWASRVLATIECKCVIQPHKNLI